MTCHNCNTLCKKFEKHRNGLQRFRCKQCRKTFTEDRPNPLGGMYLSLEKATLILQLLLKGMSIRSVEQTTGVHRNTIMRLLVVAGQKRQRLMDSRICNIPVSDVQCDEIWGFCFKKKQHKGLHEVGRKDIGDAYTLVAFERNSKLVVTFHLSRRDKPSTEAFVEKLRRATSDKRFQISTDGFGPYINAIDYSLIDRCDYAQLVKVYSKNGEADHRYSQADFVKAVPTPVMGKPKGIPGTLFLLVQLLPGASEHPHDASNGSRDHGSHLGHWRDSGVSNADLGHYLQFSRALLARLSPHRHSRFS